MGLVDIEFEWDGLYLVGLRDKRDYMNIVQLEDIDKKLKELEALKERMDCFANTLVKLHEAIEPLSGRPLSEMMVKQVEDLLREKAEMRIKQVENLLREKFALLYEDTKKEIESYKEAFSEGFKKGFELGQGY